MSAPLIDCEGETLTVGSLVRLAGTPAAMRLIGASADGCQMILRTETREAKDRETVVAPRGDVTRCVYGTTQARVRSACGCPTCLRLYPAPIAGAVSPAQAAREAAASVIAARRRGDEVEA